MISRIHPTAVIYPGVLIDCDVDIGAFCVIGAPPEHKEFYDRTKETFGVRIKAGARISPHVTIDAGTIRQTTIDNGVAIFNHSHIAHDCIIGRNATIGGNVSLAGHCHIMEGATVSGKSCLVQRAVVGAYGFLGGMSYLTRHLPPAEKWVGYNARFIGRNTVGLERSHLLYEDVILKYQEEFEHLIKDCPL